MRFAIIPLFAFLSNNVHEAKPIAPHTFPFHSKRKSASLLFLFFIPGEQVRNPYPSG
jgi:hypothetical protein